MSRQVPRPTRTDVTVTVGADARYEVHHSRTGIAGVSITAGDSSLLLLFSEDGDGIGRLEEALNDLRANLSVGQREAVPA